MNKRIFLFITGLCLANSSTHSAIAASEIDDDAEAIEETLVVTGTRSHSRTLTDSTVAVDIFDADQIMLQPHADLTETLKNLLPSYSAMPFTGDGNAFIRSTSLRGLSPDQTLVLVNSKRRHRSALIHHQGAAISQGAHAADIAPLPAIALKRIEILRDGAAAQYGSDAIAGVMNFILKDDPAGALLEVQRGEYFAGEETFKISANGGFDWISNGFVNLSAEYTDNEQLHRGFQPAAAQAAIDAGIPNVGTDSPYPNDPFAQTWGRPDNGGFRSAWNLGKTLADGTELYAPGNFADTWGRFRFFYRPPGISGDPADNHPTLRPMPLDPTDPSSGNFCWCDSLTGGYTPYLEADIRDFSQALGLRGSLSSRLNFDFSAHYGSSLIKYHLFNTLNPTYGPESPRNFHPGDLDNSEANVNADLTYQLSDTSVLFWGAEWREETYEFFAGDVFSWQAGPWAEVGLLIDPTTGNNYFFPPNGSNGLTGLPPSSAGRFSRDNWAIYGDLEWDVSAQWLLQLALRVEDYVDFGSTTNGKISSRYHLSDDLVARGVISTGFRAPTPGQSNLETIVTTFNTNSGLQVNEGTLRPSDPLLTSLGGKALAAEHSRNISLGFTLDIGDTGKLSLDGYRIDVRDRIVKTFDIDVSNNPIFAGSNFTSLAFYTNGIETKTQGFDLVAETEAAWQRGWTTKFALALNHNRTRVVGQNPVNGINPVSESTIFNIENSLPEYRTSAMARHESDKWSYIVRFNWYDETIDERNDREKVKSLLLTDLEVRYRVTEALNVIVGANNLFDEFPNQIDARVVNGLPYPRRSPTGYDGGLWYLKLAVRF